MKVMLLSLPGMSQGDGNLFPLGIGYLAGSLKADHAVESHHFSTMKQARKEIPQRIERQKPDVVGLSCTTFNRGFVQDTIKQLKVIGKNARIVVGGVHASYCHAQVLKEYGADIVVIGEGEKTFAELCDTLDAGTPLRSVKGISYRDGDELLLTPPRDPIANLDGLPIPDFTYAAPFIERAKMGFLITSRGCPVRCTFCSTSGFWGQKVRMNSPSRVVDEMEMLISRFKVKRIFFHDDTFNLGIPRVKEICAEIIRRGIKVDWGCSCRVAPVSEEMIACMVEAGCRHICWGVESGSEQILKTIDKKISLDQIRNAFNLSKRHSDVMSTGAFTMVGNPGESKETVLETENFFNTIPITDAPGTAILYVLPGTVLYENLRNRGYITDEDWLRSGSVPLHTIENSLLTLTRWAKRISASGIRVPFDPDNHIWRKESSGDDDSRDVTILHKIGNLAVRLGMVALNIRGYLLPGRLLFFKIRQEV
jgi:anaerobic magnesium-protoporphyrin IX monomethyl ester cyclase